MHCTLITVDHIGSVDNWFYSELSQSNLVTTERGDAATIQSSGNSAACCCHNPVTTLLHTIPATQNKQTIIVRQVSHLHLFS